MVVYICNPGYSRVPNYKLWKFEAKLSSLGRLCLKKQKKKKFKTADDVAKW